MFPVTVFYRLFGLADFSPYGYAVTLGESIGKMSSQLLETFSTGAGINGSTNVSVVVDEINVTLPHKLNPATNLLVAQLSNPTVITTFTSSIQDYVPGGSYPTIVGGALVFNGYVTGNWSLSPYVALTVPLPIFMGGTGVSATSSSTFKQELGTDYPSFSMKRIFEDFTGKFYEGRSSPWHIVKKTAGLATADISTTSYFSGDAVPGAASAYLGLLKIATKGFTSGDISEVGSMFMSYGSRGFLHPINGGPIHFKARIRPSNEFTLFDVCRMQIGLKGDLGARSTDFINNYGLGFEVSSFSNSQFITVLCATPGKVSGIPTGIAFASSQFYDLEIKISPFDKIVYFYINGFLVHTESLVTWPDSQEVLLHPAVSHSTYTSNERSLFVDYILTTQKVNRG